MCKLCRQDAENNKHPLLEKVWGRVSEMTDKSMSSRIRFSRETIVIGLTSDDTEYHIISVVVFICKLVLCV